MKRRGIAIGATFAMTVMLLAGCAGKAAPGEQEEVQKNAQTETQEEVQENAEPIKLTYSFLYDDATREEVRSIMEADGVDKESTDSFMKIVTQFADTLGEMKGAADGFTTIEDVTGPFYDSEYIGMTFDKKLGFDDQNCRLTAYSLFHDFYTVSEDSSFVYDDSLYGDQEILKLNKNLSFSDADIKEYTTLFSDVETDGSMDTATHAKNVKDVWAERGITFDPESKTQLLSVMLHDPNRNTVFAGHAGVLFETEEGYLLIEKLSQYTPFVAAKFEDLESLNAYLLSEVKIAKQEGASDSFVMRDDEPLV